MHGGRDRSGKDKEGSGNGSSNGGAGKVKDSMRCFRCKAAGHYSDRWTTNALQKVWWRRTRGQQVRGGDGERIAGGGRVCDDGGSQR